MKAHCPLHAFSDDFGSEENTVIDVAGEGDWTGAIPRKVVILTEMKRKDKTDGDRAFAVSCFVR